MRSIVSTRPNIFNTCNRVEHARERKMVSHISFLKSLLPYIRLHVEALLGRRDKFAQVDKKGLSGTDGLEGTDGLVRYPSL